MCTANPTPKPYPMYIANSTLETHVFFSSQELAFSLVSSPLLFSFLSGLSLMLL